MPIKARPPCPSTVLLFSPLQPPLVARGLVRRRHPRMGTGISSGISECLPEAGRANVAHADCGFRECRRRVTGKDGEGDDVREIAELLNKPAQDFAQERQEVEEVYRRQTGRLVNEWANAMVQGMELCVAVNDEEEGDRTLVRLDPKMVTLDLDLVDWEGTVFVPLTSVERTELAVQPLEGGYEAKCVVLHLNPHWSAAHKASSLRKLTFQFDSDRSRLLFALAIKVLRHQALAAGRAAAE